MEPFFREGWTIEEPKSNPSPAVELTPKFRKHKLKSNPLAISIGSLQSDVKERQLVSSGIRGWGSLASESAETCMIYMWTIKSGQEVVKMQAQCCQSCIVVMHDNGILRTNAFHMCPHPCNDRSKISEFTCPMRDFTWNLNMISITLHQVSKFLL